MGRTVRAPPRETTLRCAEVSRMRTLAPGEFDAQAGQVGGTHAGIRAAALVPSDEFSGPARQAVSTAIELAKHGVEVRFVLLCRRACATGLVPSYLDRLGMLFEVLEDRGPLDLRLALRVRRLLNQWQPRIVETHGYKASAIALGLTRLPHSWRWVAYFHGLTSESLRARFYHWLDQRMLGRADRVIVVSEEQRLRLLRWAPSALLVQNAVTMLDPSSSAAEAASIATCIEQSSPPHIAVVGRLSPEKGVDVFLRAAALLVSRGVRFSALIVGDGRERAQLDRQATSLGIGDHIQFLGKLSGIAQLYERIDLLVIPSRSEGLPNVLLEALHADVAVVSTRVGSIPEVLSIAESGILVAPDSPAALAQGIEEGLARLNTETARAARAAAARAYSQARRAASLVALYRELLGRSHP